MGTGEGESCAGYVLRQARWVRLLRGKRWGKGECEEILGEKMSLQRQTGKRERVRVVAWERRGSGITLHR